MAFIDTWRRELEESFDLFATLVIYDRSFNLQHGILAGALLWPVLYAPCDDERRQALEAVCSVKHLPHILTELVSWERLTPLEAARQLAKHAENSVELRTALELLFVYFRDEWLHQMLKPAPPTISVGDVSGANIVIGGVQYIAGDLLITYLQPKAERTCPRPPREPEHFGGRGAELEALSVKLKAGQMAGITTAIHGLGGVGKTTLAKVLANHLFQDHTFRAVLWGDVTRNPDAIRLLNDWVVSYADSSFATSKFTGEARDRQIAAAAKVLLEDVIGERCEPCEPPRVLVVLDDVWDNGLDAARLIQSACPDGSTILITTRSEQLARNLHANAELLSHMDADEAVKLLQAYLPDAETDALQALGEALGGHPLAMELAARRVNKERGRPGETLASVLARCTAEYRAGIPKGTPFVDLRLEAGEKREDNLTAALALSYEDLSDADKAHFRALGVLAYDVSFDRALLAALWEVKLGGVDDHCDTLRLLSLMEGAPEVGKGWYRQHPLLRAYAHALLEASKETEVAFAHYADHIIGVARAFRALPPEAWSVLEHHIPHVHTVGDELIRRYDTTNTPDIELMRRVMVFSLSIVQYVFMRREVLYVSVSS